MLGECQARPAACDAALASPERRAKDCRHWETAFERPGARRNVRVPQPKHLRGRPGVRGLRRHRPGPEGRAQSPDGRAHRLSGSPELSTPARDLVVRGFRPMRTQLLLDSTPPRRVQTRSQPQILGQDPRQLPPPSRNPELPGYRRRRSRNSFSVSPPLVQRVECGCNLLGVNSESHEAALEYARTRDCGRGSTKLGLRVIRNYTGL